MLELDKQLLEQGLQVEQLLRGWITGGAPIPETTQLPEAWQSILRDEPLERHGLLLLALSSQFQALLYESRSEQALDALPDLPILSLPTLANSHRPLFRRLLDNLRRHAGLGAAPLLQLLMQRGVSAHPADWLPSVNDDALPGLYWPWSRWVARQQTVDEEEEQLDAESWDSFFPAERLMRLRAMRHSDPDTARALMEQCAESEPADKRLKIIELLAINLAEADTEYLQSQLTNRSQKIVRLASQLLARLGVSLSEGQGEKAQDMAQELADTYEIKTGILKRRRSIVPRKLKNKKQESIRSEQLQQVLFHELAQALQISPEELASGWQFAANRDTDNHALVLNAVGSLSTEQLNLLLNNALGEVDSGEAMLSLVKLFVPRLPAEQRSKVMYQLLNNRSLRFGFEDALSFSDQPLHELDWSQLRKLPAWRQLQSLLKEHKDEAGYVEHYQLQVELFTLGLLLPQSLAQKALEEFTQNGVMNADPALDALKLNAQLNPDKPPISARTIP